MDSTFYSEQEARDILKRASKIELQERDFSDEHLRQMAEELGLSEQALVLAKEQHLAAREQQAEDAAVASLKIEFDQGRRKAFRIHLLFFAVMMPLLAGINLLTSPEFLWFFIPLLGWMAGLVGHYWSVQQDEGPYYEPQLSQWLAQNKDKRAQLKNVESPKSLGAG